MQDGILHKDSTIFLATLHIAITILLVYNYIVEVKAMGGKNSYESIKKYQDKAYDKILVRIPKGQKDTIQAHAQAQGESVNSFIGRAISETIERDKAAPAADEE